MRNPKLKEADKTEHLRNQNTEKGMTYNSDILGSFLRTFLSFLRIKSSVLNFDE